MKIKQILIKNLQRTSLYQAGSCILVLIIVWRMDWLNPHTIGIIYTCVGGSILAVSSFFMLNGYIFSSWAVYSLSGAGRMVNHPKIISEAAPGRAVFLIFALLNGFILILIGFLLQKMGG